MHTNFGKGEPVSERQGMKHIWGTSATGGGERPTCDTDVKEPGGVAAIVGTGRVCREGGVVPIWDVEGHHGGESIYFFVSDGLISHKWRVGDETYEERRAQSGGQTR